MLFFKKGCSICAWIFISLVALGADTVRIGEPYPVQDATAKYYFSNGDNILTVKVRGSLIILQKFNVASLSQLSLHNEKLYAHPFLIEGVEEICNSYYIFFSSWNESERREELLAQEVSIDSCSFIGEPKLIATSGTKVAPFTGYKNEKRKFRFYYSFDRTKLLIQYRLYQQEKDDKKNFDRIGLHVLDSNLTKVWGKVITLPYTEHQLRNLDYAVDRKGNIYLMSLVYNRAGRMPVFNDSANYRLEVFTIREGASGIKKAGLPSVTN